jgi:hypothetical protein
MNHRNIQYVFAAIALMGLLVACSSSKAPGTTSVPLSLPADASTAAVSDASTAAAPDASQPAASGSVTTSIPAATDDIWKALDKQGADLEAAIQKGSLKDVQARADAIRDLTAALPAHASKLSADAQAKLQQDVTLVASYVEKLDAAGNAGDQAGTKANYKKLNDVLGGIARFP